jgi:hypothetical protein
MDDAGRRIDGIVVADLARPTEPRGGKPWTIDPAGSRYRRGLRASRPLTVRPTTCSRGDVGPAPDPRSDFDDDQRLETAPTIVSLHCAHDATAPAGAVRAVQLGLFAADVHARVPVSPGQGGADSDARPIGRLSHAMKPISVCSDHCIRARPSHWG